MSSLRRTQMMRGRGAKTKGGAEREVVAIAQRHGFTDARRNFMSGGQGGGDIIGIPDIHPMTLSALTGLSLDEGAHKPKGKKR